MRNNENTVFSRLYLQSRLYYRLASVCLSSVCLPVCLYRMYCG